MAYVQAFDRMTRTLHQPKWTAKLTQDHGKKTTRQYRSRRAAARRDAHLL